MKNLKEKVDKIIVEQGNLIPLMHAHPLFIKEGEPDFVEEGGQIILNICGKYNGIPVGTIGKDFTQEKKHSGSLLTAEELREYGLEFLTPFISGYIEGRLLYLLLDEDKFERELMS